MHSSPILSAGTCVLGQLWNSLALFQQSVSLDEKITRMEELTSTLLLISAKSIEQEIVENSMWAAAIQMSSLLGEHQRKVGTMQSRMGMWSQEDSNDQKVGDMARRMLINGLRLRLQRAEESFGILFTSLIQRLQHAASPVSASTLIGNSLLTLPSMSHRTESGLCRGNLMGEITGWHKLVWAWEKHE